MTEDVVKQLNAKQEMVAIIEPVSGETREYLEDAAFRRPWQGGRRTNLPENEFQQQAV